LSTIYDLITVALFAGLVILFLQRSTEPETPNDRIIYYLPPAVGCALANWLGNNHQDIWAVIALVAVVIYSYMVLKPFQKTP
jgi:apolipoprotein N-acyltransferase